MSGDERIIIPWRVIDGPESADAVAAEIMKTPVRRGSSTSISGAINFALQLFEENPYRGLRRVIDISGDGPNNNGAPRNQHARRGLGEGHHHQRPTDHGEEAILSDDRYRESRSLLRGLVVPKPIIQADADDVAGLLDGEELNNPGGADRPFNPVLAKIVVEILEFP